MALIDISKIKKGAAVVKSAQSHSVVRSFEGLEKSKLEDIYRDRLPIISKVFSELAEYNLSKIKEFNEKNDFSEVLYSLGINSDVLTTQLLSYVMPRHSMPRGGITTEKLSDFEFCAELKPLIGMSDDMDIDYLGRRLFGKDVDEEDYEFEHDVQSIVDELYSSSEFSSYIYAFNDEVGEEARDEAERLFDQRINLKDSENLFVYKYVKESIGFEVCNVSSLVEEPSHLYMAMQYNCVIQTIIHAIILVLRKAYNSEFFKKYMLELADDEVFHSSDELPLLGELSRKNAENVASFLRRLASEISKEEFDEIHRLIISSGASSLNYKDDSYAKDFSHFVFNATTRNDTDGYAYSVGKMEFAQYKSINSDDGTRAVVNVSVPEIEKVFYPIFHADAITQFGDVVLAIFSKSDGSKRQLEVFGKSGNDDIRVDHEYPFMAKHYFIPTIKIHRGSSSVNSLGESENIYNAEAYTEHSTDI